MKYLTIAFVAALSVMGLQARVLASGTKFPSPGDPSGPEAYPVEKEPGAQELLAGAGVSKDYNGADVVLVYDRSMTVVEDSGLGHLIRRRVFKVLTEKGGSLLSSLRFDWDPMSNFVTLKVARVYRRGKLLREIKPQALIDLPQPQRWIYWGARMKILPIGRLEKGDGLEVVTYEKGFRIAYLAGREGSIGELSNCSKKVPQGEQDESMYIPPMRGQYYAVPVFGGEPYPVVESIFEVEISKNKPLQFEIQGPVDSSVFFKGKQKVVYTFRAKDLPPYKEEPVSPFSNTDSLPKVVMSTVPSWQEKSTWFQQVNENQFNANPAIRKKVAELTRGKNSDEAMGAILHWVAQNIRYSGISMGKGEGYILHPGTMTFHDRCGVCKDIAGMAVTMLRAAGFEVYPAMTMAGARVEKVPADQFNHCVVAVRQKDGKFRMIDPTWAPFSRELWSNAEREQYYVIGLPKGDTLRIIPALPPDANKLVIQANGTIKENGDLKSKMVISGTGYLETRLRYHFVYHPAHDLRRQVKRLIQGISPLAEIESYKMSDIHDLHHRFTIEISYVVPGYASTGDHVMIFNMPLARNPATYSRLGLFLTAANTDKRKGDILLRSTEHRIFREKIKLPAGYEMAGVRKSMNETSGSASLAAGLVQDGGTLFFSEDIKIGKRRITPDKYNDYKRVIDAIKALGRMDVFVEKIPGQLRNGGDS
ncbi:MAG: DUF3857 and transglutaminase domain-containing protein [Deltaproteobacteria bacterium]|nr:DUF3857 and transglutaminase domain-containing protein [Deltaproteobacteria bacterium]